LENEYQGAFENEQLHHTWQNQNQWNTVV
jgi:hypothetical protein